MAFEVARDPEDGRVWVGSSDEEADAWNQTWGQACDFCDFGFDSTGCGACAPLFRQAGGQLALTSDLAEGITMSSKSRALSVCI
jgi:hypothetical protein